MQCPDLCAIILASGKGSRFGMPKAEALLDTGETFLSHIRNLLLESGLTNISAIIGRETPDMLSSLRLGISEAPPAEGYLVYPVDFPFVLPATIVSLIQAFLANPHSVIRPVYQGKSGHPIIIPAITDVYSLDSEGGLAGIIRRQGLSILDLPVTDPGVLRNVNYPHEMNTNS